MTPRPMPAICSRCNKCIKTRELIKCSLCSCIYDLQCANISAARFYNTDMERKNTWKCPSGCPEKEQKVREPKTPKQSTGIEASVQNVISPVLAYTKVPKPPTFSTKSIALPATENAHDTYEITTSDEKSSAGLTEGRFLQMLKQELSPLKTQNTSMSIHLKQIDDKFNAFQDALSFINTQFEELKATVNEKNNIIASLEKKNASLETSVQDLSNRLSLVEQHMRESNVEVNGLPEHRTEDLCKTVLQIAKTVKCDITGQDVLHVTRVAKINKDSKAPRSVIVKLRSPRIRDAFLAAVSQFNKSNNKDKLSSEHLHISGPRVPVFVAEHLTPFNKSLHAAARRRAKELGYKFVWVRSGKIFMRKDETSQPFYVRNFECLNQLK